MIFHIVQDEKFIDNAFLMFEKIEEIRSEFIIIGEKRQLRYIKQTPINFVNFDDFLEMTISFNCKAVIFHTLSKASLEIVCELKENIKTIWFGWGFDYYYQFLSTNYKDGIIKNMTKRNLVRSIHPVKSNYYLRHFYRLIKSWYSVFYFKDAYKRIDLFSTIIDIEYLNILSKNKWFSPRYFEWSYITYENDMKYTGINRVNGNNILVGNSASPENNHIDAFHFIKEKMLFKYDKVIVPLSYGENWYRNLVCRIGQRMFGTDFVPLIKFINKEDYFKLLSSCKVVIMDHLRQQGLGNICFMLAIGSTIIFDKRNPLYIWLRDNGATVYNIQEIDQGRLFNNKSEELKIRNRMFVKKIWGTKNVLKRLKDCLFSEGII